MGYARSPFGDFESYLRFVVGLDEHDVQFILEQNNSNFVTYEISLGFHTIKGISEAVYTWGDVDGTIQIEYDISMKTKLILTRFRSTFGSLNFDKGSFFNTSLGFPPYWDYKPTNAIYADSPGVYTCDKILNFNAIKKIQLKCDVIDGLVVNGIRQPTLFSFILDKPAG